MHVTYTYTVCVAQASIPHVLADSRREGLRQETLGKQQTWLEHLLGKSARACFMMF